jgi:hypothetical protein
MMKRFAVVLAAIGIFGGAAWATPITYTESVTGTGMLGATGFTNSLVTVTVLADTSNIVIFSGGVLHSGAGTGTINVAGIGTATLTGPDIEVVLNQTNGNLGVSDLTAGRVVFFTQNAVFDTYDLKSSIGPDSGTALFNLQTAPSSLGGFEFSSVSGNSTFTATLAPEPTSTMLLGTGLLALVALSRFRRA